MYDYREVTALVTGASSGIGEALARSLAAARRRRPGLGGALGRQIGTAGRGTADAARHHCRRPARGLERPAAIPSLKEETDRRGLRVDLLVNNAGFGSSGPFETLPPQREADMVTVNVAATVALTRAYLPEIVARGRGGVLNVASTAGFQPTPYMATYGATKAFILLFTEALWAEMRDQGRRDVRVSCLCPGATATEFGANVGRDRGRFEFAALCHLCRSRRGRIGRLGTEWPVVIVGRANAAGAFLTRFAPRAAVARMSATLLRPQGVQTPPPSKAPLGIALGLLAGGLLFQLARRWSD